jgi:hypothetical protein
MSWVYLISVHTAIVTIFQWMVPTKSCTYLFSNLSRNEIVYTKSLSVYSQKAARFARRFLGAAILIKFREPNGRLGRPFGSLNLYQ